MARIRFTQNLRRHVSCEETEVPTARTVREALDACFAENPTLRGYVLDEHGALRHHMMIFVDGRHLRDRVKLGDTLAEGSEIDVIQALSGG